MTMSSVQLGDRQMKPISRFRQRALTREHDSSEPLPTAYRPHMSIRLFFFLPAGGSIACFFGSKWRHWSYVISRYSFGPPVLALRVLNRLMNFYIIFYTLLEGKIKFWQIFCLSPFWDTFAKLRKETISLVMSLFPHEKTRLPLDRFSSNFIFKCLSKNNKNNNKHNEYFTWRPIYISFNISIDSSQN